MVASITPRQRRLFKAREHFRQWYAKHKVIPSSAWYLLHKSSAKRTEQYV